MGVQERRPQLEARAGADTRARYNVEPRRQLSIECGADVRGCYPAPERGAAGGGRKVDEDEWRSDLCDVPESVSIRCAVGHDHEQARASLSSCVPLAREG